MFTSSLHGGRLQGAPLLLQLAVTCNALCLCTDEVDLIVELAGLCCCSTLLSAVSLSLHV